MKTYMIAVLVGALAGVMPFANAANFDGQLLGSGWELGKDFGEINSDAGFPDRSLHEQSPSVSGNKNFSALVQENIFVWGDHSIGRFGYDDEFDRFDVNNTGLGLGLRAPVFPTNPLLGHSESQASPLDLFGGLSVEQMSLGINDEKNDGLGYGLTAGVKAALTPSFQFNSGVKYSEFGDEINSVRYSMGASYAFTPGLSFNVDYARSALNYQQDLKPLDDDVFTVGFRYLFGGDSSGKSNLNLGPIDSE